MCLSSASTPANTSKLCHVVGSARPALHCMIGAGLPIMPFGNRLQTLHTMIRKKHARNARCSRVRAPTPSPQLSHNSRNQTTTGDVTHDLIFRSRKRYTTKRQRPGPASLKKDALRIHCRTTLSPFPLHLFVVNRFVILRTAWAK